MKGNAAGGRGSVMPDDLISRIDALDIERFMQSGAWPSGMSYEQFCAALGKLALAGMAARENETILGRHSGKSAHREWWSGGTWLYPGDVVIERGTTPERGKP